MLGMLGGSASIICVEELSQIQKTTNSIKVLLVATRLVWAVPQQRRALLRRLPQVLAAFESLLDARIPGNHGNQNFKRDELSVDGGGSAHD
jgi:hypothetical protein